MAVAGVTRAVVGAVVKGWDDLALQQGGEGVLDEEERGRDA